MANIKEFVKGNKILLGSIAGLTLFGGSIGREPIGNFIAENSNTRPADAAPTKGQTSADAFTDFQKQLNSAREELGEVKQQLEKSKAATSTTPEPMATAAQTAPRIETGARIAAAQTVTSTVTTMPNVSSESFPKGKADILQPNCAIVGDVSYRDESGKLNFAPGESDPKIGTILLTDKNANVEASFNAEKVCARSKEEIAKYADQQALDMQKPGQGCGMVDGCANGVNIVKTDGTKRLVKAGKDGIVQGGKNGGTIETSPTPTPQGQVIKVEKDGKEITIIVNCCPPAQAQAQEQVCPTGTPEAKAIPKPAATPTVEAKAECPADDFEVGPEQRIKVKKGDIILGDVALRKNESQPFVPYYDNNEETGLRTMIEEDGEAFSKWGIDVFRPCPVDENKEEFKAQTEEHLRRTVIEMGDKGCDKSDGDGCDVVIDKSFPSGATIRTNRIR